MHIRNEPAILCPGSAKRIAFCGFAISANELLDVGKVLGCFLGQALVPIRRVEFAAVAPPVVRGDGLAIVPTKPVQALPHVGGSSHDRLDGIGRIDAVFIGRIGHEHHQANGAFAILGYRPNRLRVESRLPGSDPNQDVLIDTVCIGGNLECLRDLWRDGLEIERE